MLKMKQAYEVEIYISEQGYLAFKQEDTFPNEDCNLVLLSYEQALVLRDYLPKLIEQQEEAWGGGVNIEQKDTA